jgi:hypothetical protein
MRIYRVYGIRIFTLEVNGVLYNFIFLPACITRIYPKPNEDMKWRNRSGHYSLCYSTNRFNTLFWLTKGIPCSVDPSSCIYFSPLLSSFVFSCFTSFPSSFPHICASSHNFLNAYPSFLLSNFLFDLLPEWSPCFHCSVFPTFPSISLLFSSTSSRSLHFLPLFSLYIAFTHYVITEWNHKPPRSG